METSAREQTVLQLFKTYQHKHFSRICRQPNCSVENCGHRHHQLSHGEQSLATPRHLSNTSLSGLASTKPALPTKETLLQTALASLIVKDQEMIVRVLLDSGSQHSYTRKNIAETLDLKDPSELLSVTTLGEKNQRGEHIPKSEIYPFTTEGRFKGEDRHTFYFQNL